MHPAKKAGFRSERGAVALIAVISMTIILGFAAIVIDVGSLYAAKRQLQGATDAAALSATYPIAQGSTTTTPLAMATNYLAKNVPGAGIVSVTSGTYCPDSSIASAANRFLPGAGQNCINSPDIAGLNAVKVTSSISSPLYFAGVFAPSSMSKTIQVSATAAQINEAGFYAGTGLLSINAGVLNSVLGQLLGANVNLTLAQYNALAAANVDALSFFNALATNVGVTTGTYNSLLQSSATVQNVVQSEIDVLNAQGNVANATAITALTALKAAIVGSPSVTLSNLFDLGVWQDVGVGSSTSSGALSATLNALQLASLTAQVANGENAVSIPNSSFGIPGVATLTAATTVIEPPQGPAYVFGPVGVTAHTAQIRLQLSLQLLSALSLGGALGTAPVSLPIYVEAASGNAQLTAINCAANPATDATVTIDGKSALATAYVGTVTTNAMQNVSTPVTVSPATLVNVLGLVKITASSQPSIGAVNETQMTFTQTQIANGTSQSTGSASTLFTSLGNSLTLSGTLTVLGITTTLPANGTVLTSLKTLLTPAFAGMNTLVASVLTALGIDVGYMNVTATGIRCGVPVLVN